MRLALVGGAFGLSGCTGGEWARSTEREVVAERVLVAVEPTGRVTPFFVVHESAVGSLVQRYAILSRQPGGAIVPTRAQLEAEIRAIRQMQQTRR